MKDEGFCLLFLSLSLIFYPYPSLTHSLAGGCRTTQLNEVGKRGKTNGLLPHARDWQIEKLMVSPLREIGRLRSLGRQPKKIDVAAPSTTTRLG